MTTSALSDGLHHGVSTATQGSYEDQLARRRPSVRINSQVRLEDGQRRSVHEPLPHSHGLDKHAVKLAERYPKIRPEFVRVHSEADLRSFDPTTGRLLARKTSHFSRDAELAEAVRSPFSSTFEISAPEAPTIESFRSPVVPPKIPPVDPPSSKTDSGLKSAPDGAFEPTLSPYVEARNPTGELPPFLYPHSLEDSSAWPVALQHRGGRQKIGIAEQKLSLRNSRRQSARRSTTSSSASPATAFLSRFAREESVQEPDADGQEVGDYMLGKQVGFGGFSVIKEAFSLRPSAERAGGMAVKIVRKQLPSKDELENERLQTQFEHEVQLWRQLGHLNILPLIEVFENKFATYCFTKLNTGGTLFDRVKTNRKGLSLPMARHYVLQLASAIRYLHEDERIVHRDIKMENCLVDVADPAECGNLLLCDFGLAEYLPDSGRTKHESLTAPHSGSLEYASPELILSSHGFLHPAPDIWAFGVLLYAILIGELPFQHVFQPRVQMMILAGEWDLHQLNQSLRDKSGQKSADEQSLNDLTVNDNAADTSAIIDLVQGCLHMCWDRRWSIAQILQSAWLELS